MASLELEGKIKAKLASQSGNGARGGWIRQDFVIEYPDGNYTADACFSAWGQDKVDDLARFQVGDAVKVSFAVKAREYSGRWYNDLRIWKIAPAGAGQQPQRPANQQPAYQQPAPPAPSIDDMPADFGDDMPF